MTRSFIVKIVLACVLACAFSHQAPAQTQTVSRTHVHSRTAAAMISQLRRSQGLGPVSVDPELTRFAQAHAQAMASHMQMGHDVGASFSERRRSIRARIVVENVGAAY